MDQYYSKNGEILFLIQELLSELESASIVYCHWKSNIDLDLSFSAEGDLDLLVDRRYSGQFDRLILKMGFKRGLAPYERQFPGIEDYIGWDRETGKLVHLHVHYQLVLGAVYVKGLHLPLEQEILRGRRREGPIMISSPESELFVFVMRCILKIRFYDVLRRRKSSKKSVEELEFLEMKSNDEKIDELLTPYSISIVEFNEMKESLRNREPFGIYRMKRSLERELGCFLRFGALVRWSRPLATRGKYMATRFLGTAQGGKKPTTGGLIIAAVGSDGSGKSSMIEELKRWLKPQYGVKSYHLGHPKQNIISYVILRLGCRIRDLGLKEGKSNFFAKYGDLLVKYYVAKDRVRLYSKIRAHVGKGYVAIVDRHPLSGIGMDGPSGVSRYLDADSRIIRNLAQKINKCYKVFKKPDLLIVLKVSLEVASQRRPEDTLEYLTERIQAVDTIDTNQDGILELDAEKQHIQVFNDAKEFVWTCL